MSATTCIRNIAWLIAWDPREARHVFRRDADLAFAGDRIVFVGVGYAGPAEAEIDGRGLMVCPGLVDIHCHGAGQIHYKGVREDLSNRHFFGSALYDFTTRFLPDEAGHKAGLNFALGELLLSGTTSVAHCPTVFSRYGQTLQDFGRYRRAGITLGIGTDTLPHNMLEEMRTAIVAGRIASGYADSVYPADVLEAATVGGARMLGRDDIGRLAVGAKADLFTVDLSHPAMRPLRDPLRSLIYTAAERPVRDVFVDGRKVVAEGRLTTIDMAAAAAEIEAAQRRMEAAVLGLDPDGRSAAELAPYSLPIA
jgi:cytosine/adenosine deaminase-related metal-dependent hydrolase